LPPPLLSISEDVLLTAPLIFLSAAFRFVPPLDLLAVQLCGRPRLLLAMHAVQPPAFLLLLLLQLMPLPRLAPLPFGV
jgi:hypothetical protein